MKYFVFSRAQMKELSGIASKINKKFVPGKVYIKGAYNPYTEILSVPTSRYSDAKVIFTTEDDTLNTVNYSNPAHTN